MAVPYRSGFATRRHGCCCLTYEWRSLAGSPRLIAAVSPGYVVPSSREFPMRPGTAPVHGTRSRTWRALMATAFCGLLGTASHAGAADLRLGIALEPSSLDPHFQWFGASIAMARQVFEPLITIGEDGNPNPLLATSWEPVGDNA